MKKALWLPLTILLAFICVMGGIFVGRNLMPNYITIQNVVSSSFDPAATKLPINNNEHTSETVQSEAKVNINTADAEMLSLLPGIGEILAQRIIEYREQNGFFTNTEDLLLVEGIGESRLKEILDYITVGG